MINPIPDNLNILAYNQTNRFLKLDVEDTGQGIRGKDLKTLFEMF